MATRVIWSRRIVPVLLVVCSEAVLAGGCVEPLGDTVDATAVGDTGPRPDASDVRPADAPIVVDGAALLDAPASADLAGVDTAAVDTARDAPGLLDTAADAAASPCPGGPAPPGHGLRCGCSSLGTITCAGTCSVDDGSCVPVGEFYLLSNAFLGDGRVLDTYGGAAPNNAYMNVPGYSGSHWKVTPLGDGHHSLTNMFMLDSHRLEAAADGSKLFLGVAGPAATQAWRITGAGNGSFRIRNKALGAGRSLDTRADGNNDPWMGETGDYSGQYWKMTKKM
jgi:hypothetical protein